MAHELGIVPPKSAKLIFVHVVTDGRAIRKLLFAMNAAAELDSTFVYAPYYVIVENWNIARGAGSRDTAFAKIRARVLGTKAAGEKLRAR